MDGDIYGPSMPTLLGIKGQTPRLSGNKIIPHFVHGIHAITMGSLVEPEKPLIWRGPMAHGALPTTPSRQHPLARTRLPHRRSPPRHRRRPPHPMPASPPHRRGDRRHAAAGRPRRRRPRYPHVRAASDFHPRPRREHELFRCPRRLRARPLRPRQRREGRQTNGPSLPGRPSAIHRASRQQRRRHPGEKF